MNRKHSPVFLQVAILVLSLTSVACQALAGTEPNATQGPQQPSATVDSNNGTGSLCVGSTTGLSCLDENGWQTYTDENSFLPNSYLYAGAVCPDGQIAIAHINGVVLFDGSVFKQIPDKDGYATIDGVACDANGDIWAAHFQGVSHYSNGLWTTYASDQLASGESANELVYGVQVAPDGKVWVVTSRSVAKFENDTWTIYQEGQGFNSSRFFSAIALDAMGRPWTAHGNGVDVFENGTWRTIQKSDYNSPSSLAVDAKGQVWFGTLFDGVYLFDNRTWTQHGRASEDLRSDHIRAIAADSSGRVWFGTSYGLTVFDGLNWQTLLMSNSSLHDNDIQFIVVTNDGPALPALEEKAHGSITGKLVDANNNTMADMRVEICVETISSTFYGDTPCSDQPFFLSTRTDADGVFLLEDVPAGYYVIVAETSTGWAQLMSEFGITSEKTMIQAGEAYDIETLTLEN
jgi:Two component regulator propeller